MKHGLACPCHYMPADGYGYFYPQVALLVIARLAFIGGTSIPVELLMYWSCNRVLILETFRAKNV